MMILTVVDKNMKARDAIEIVRQQKARAAMGKSSVVYVRGRRVEPSKMQQYLHRVSESVANEILLNTADDLVTEYNPYSSNARVIVRTPSPDINSPGSPLVPKRLDDPTDFRLPQECMQILTGHLSGGYESRKWEINPETCGPDTINSCA